MSVLIQSKVFPTGLFLNSKYSFKIHYGLLWRPYQEMGFKIFEEFQDRDSGWALI